MTRHSARICFFATLLFFARSSEELAHNGLTGRGQVRRVSLLFGATTRGLCALKPQTPGAERPVRECATCHPKQAKPQLSTPMAHAAETVAECYILKEHPDLKFRSGKYSYAITRKGDESIYSVTDGEDTITVPLGWAFGLGAAGQTYVFQKDGKLYESSVSFYKAIDALDVTMGSKNKPPGDILQAAGREMGKHDAAQCFHCHTTNTGTGNNLALGNLIAGVQCERCHGSTDAHLAGIKSGDIKLAKMPKATDGTAENVNNFCGGCHRTWEDIASGPRLGIANVRFQPYRITNSKCFDTNDPRIACTTCHDPHQELVRGAANYDVKCLACHTPGGKAKAASCKVAQTNCTSCHMPKTDMPGSHHAFTDHMIRIVRPHEQYPD